jgi:hypothetical protein
MPHYNLSMSTSIDSMFEKRNIFLVKKQFQGRLGKKDKVFLKIL